MREYVFSLVGVLLILIFYAVALAERNPNGHSKPQGAASLCPGLGACWAFSPHLSIYGESVFVYASSSLD